jgi:hypothetical protein
MKEKILTLHAKVSRTVAQEDCVLVAPSAQMTLQAQVSQMAKVLIITIHTIGPNPPDLLMTSAAIVAALLRHGVSRVQIASPLPLAPPALYLFTYLYLLLSSCVPVPELHRFKAKDMLE